MDIEKVQSGYDSVADDFAQNIYPELANKPLDRQLLDRFVASVSENGIVCDIGTGPGQVARYLHDHGARVCGIDLAPAMIKRARQLNPGIDFQEGNMFALNLANETFAGITAFYALVHIPRTEVVAALRELRRVLKANGLLFIAFHIGDHILHRDEWWGAKVSLDFYFFGVDEMTGYLKEAGFDIMEIVERDPYPEPIEQQNRRAYVFAQKTAAATS